MPRILVFLLATVLSVRAAAPPPGPDRLRELVVYPDLNLNVSFSFSCVQNYWVPTRHVDASAEIHRLRSELIQHPDDLAGLLHLAQLLWDQDDTNESQACYLRAAPLGQALTTANSSDASGFILWGTALEGLGKSAEAERAYRQATVVSPNQWRPWVYLGNFLSQGFTVTLFPENLRSLALAIGQPPAQEVLDYRPTPEALAKSEAQCQEAARCFGRALSLAPNEPEVCFQKAGFQSLSNVENCFFRYYRGQKNIAQTDWILSFFAEDTINNLKKAADLSPKNYDYIGLAADFERSHALLSGKSTDASAWPEATRESIHSAMTRLENLSASPDPQLAVGALEYHGFLNMVFGNNSAAVRDLDRVIALDPSREQSWDMLIGLQAGKASPDEMAALCEQIVTDGQ